MNLPSNSYQGEYYMNINLNSDMQLISTNLSKQLDEEANVNDANLFQQLLADNEKPLSHPEQPNNLNQIDYEGCEFDDQNNSLDGLIFPVFPYDTSMIQSEMRDKLQSSHLSYHLNSAITNPINDAINRLNSFASDITDEEQRLPVNSIDDCEAIIDERSLQINMAIKESNQNHFSANLNNTETATLIKSSNHQLSTVTNDSSQLNSVKQELQYQQRPVSTPLITNDITFNQEAAITTSSHGQDPAGLTLMPPKITTSINLPVAVTNQQWSSSLTEQIIMFNRQGIQTANIKLNPQELGSLHIKLDMIEDKMNLHMMAAHAVVKSVLESALPYLKSSLEEQGITLEQADISDFSMMNDADQSAQYQQTKNRQTPIIEHSNVIEEIHQPNQVSNHLSKSGLSIFA